jgi:hypothetical protein
MHGALMAYILHQLPAVSHATATTACTSVLFNFQVAAAGALRNLAVNEKLEGHMLAAGCHVCKHSAGLSTLIKNAAPERMCSVVFANPAQASSCLTLQHHNCLHLCAGFNHLALLPPCNTNLQSSHMLTLATAFTAACFTSQESSKITSWLRAACKCCCTTTACTVHFNLQAAAAGALRNLAVNEELEGHMLAAGCVPVLLQLAARPQEDVGVRTAALEGLR